MSNDTGRRASQRGVSKAVVNPDINGEVLDAPNALRASPDSDVDDTFTNGNVKNERNTESPLSDVPEDEPEPPKKKKAAKGGKKVAVKEEVEEPTKAPAKKSKKQAADGDEEVRADPEAEGDEEEADPEDIKAASLRPKPVNSDYLPLPWKGRLGYACLCTYLRLSNPPVFSSRTTRIASILEHRHPLKDPSQPEHPIKNRPDKDQPADIRRGQDFIEQLCLANIRDMAKMIHWNDRYNIKFFRLSSEAFPFASHPEYGYKLAPFAADALAEVGRVAAELGHRLTTHPGQFTQLGSPRPSVIENAFRDLEYHDEMLSLLKLPPQQNRDAVMILHMGGVFGDKPATLDRFRANYARLSQSVKNRLVLENDDVSWSVHELLPVCQELNIPFVLDFHHHNIIFDADKIREGTKDIVDLFPTIIETWKRKNITPKMHYSEPTPPAVTGTQRRKHNPRPSSLPPCPDNMDLMIEAKDKEQAVFELMRTFKLPGWDRFRDIVPYVRQDDNKPVKIPKKKATPKKKTKKQLEKEEEDDEAAAEASNAEAEDATTAVIPDEEVGMGGPDGRVYWPPGMEEWLRPVKRVVKKKDGAEAGKLTPAQKKAAVAVAKAEIGAEMKAKRDQAAAENGGASVDVADVADIPVKIEQTNGDVDDVESTAPPKQGKTKSTPKAKAAPKKAAGGKEGGLASSKPAQEKKSAATPTTSDEEAEDMMAQAEVELHQGYQGGGRGGRKSARATKAPKRGYTEADDEDDD